MSTQPDEFDDLYRSVRDDLLVEAYALTGDLAVARSAVRDAFSVAWHHWTKVRRVDDKVAWLRPYVWKRARARHSVRPWHKEKNLSAEVAATLAALDKLTLNQRKALVLTHLSPVPLTEAAREIGLTVPATEDLMASAGADFVQHRGVAPTEVGTHLDALRAAATGRWPRTSIVRRAGTARRRAHTVAAVLGTVALVIASGTVVAQGTNDDAALDKQGFERRPSRLDPSQVVPKLEASSLLTAPQVARVDPALSWSEASTHENTTGEGIVLPCQRTRFADTEGQALVRTFTSAAGSEKSQSTQAGKAAEKAAGKATPATAATMVELSATDESASKTFATTTSWFSACNAERTQLLRVDEVSGVGDQAVLYTFREHFSSPRTLHVGVARTGQRVVTTVSESAKTSAAVASQLLAAAVNAECGKPGAGTCAAPPKLKQATIPTAGTVPGMVSEFDLPPITKAPGPWSGNEPAKATKNTAATICDETSFSGAGFTRNLTRTFYLPDVKNPEFLGLTQTVGRTKSTEAAKKFVTGVRNKLARCADKSFGTKVTRLADKRVDGGVMTAWQVDVAVSDDESVPFLMAIMRYGSTVSQIGFVPVRDLRMKKEDFIWLAIRAQERLPRLELEGRG